MDYSFGCSFSLGEKTFAFSSPLNGSVTMADDLAVSACVREETPGRYFVYSFKNTSAVDSPLLSSLHAVDLFIPFPAPYVVPPKGRNPQMPVTLYSYAGANIHGREYSPEAHDLRPGQTLHFASAGGCSCEGILPYFELCAGNGGLIFGLGWTGQWTMDVTVTETGVRFVAGVEDVALILHPQEEIRTMSCLLCPYEGDRITGHNLFRRMMLARSPLGKQPERSFGMVNASTWGAMPTEQMLKNIRAFQENSVGVECFFIDAGWHGLSPQCPKHEHEPGWWDQAGSWNVNPYFHADGLKDVSDVAHKAGMQMLLWFEPERVNKNSTWFKEHPEWCFTDSASPFGDYLLDLGREDAYQAVLAMLSEQIETLALDWYRQDFNIGTLSHWRAHDEENRKGMTEIRYINNMYRLFDTLLARFPQLAIDNCAAGGRRNDIEMMARSVPLWRCDYQCNFDAESEITQAHNNAVSSLLPFSGTGINGGMTDDYDIRSGYVCAFMPHAWFYTVDEPVVPGQKLDNAKKMIAEYKALRDYFTRDFYPLTGDGRSLADWCVWQYHDPEKEEGAVIAFRRPEAPMCAGSFSLRGLTEGSYEFTDMDGGAVVILTSAVLTETGLPIEILSRRGSKAIRYRKLS